MRNSLYILLILILSFSFSSGYAQEIETDTEINVTDAEISVTDSVGTDSIDAEKKDGMDIVMTEESDSVRRVDFNAFNYMNLKRARSESQSFDNSRFANNMYVSFDGGVNGYLRKKGEATILIGNKFRASVSKYFKYHSGLRLSLGYANSKRKYDRKELLAFSFDADYLFSLSNYVGGFNPGRMFEIISVQGIEAATSSLDGHRGVYGNLHWGFQGKVKVGPRFNLYVEPLVNFYLGEVFPSADNLQSLNLGYTALFGIDYRFGNAYNTGNEEEEISGNEGYFFSFAGGVQAQNSYFTRDMGLRHALGPSIQFSVGKWLIPQIGLKLTGFASADSWRPIDLEKIGYNRLAAYGGGRVELIANTFKFFKRTKELPFSVEPSAGLEFGLGFKQDENLRKVNYLGFTGAVQFKYKVEDGVSLFIEPRYSRVPYGLKKPNVIGEITETRYVDNLISLNFGVEVSNMRGLFEKENISDKDKFIPHLIFSTGIGPAMVVQQRHHYNRTVGHSANIDIGYLFNPVSGIRVDLNTGTVTSHDPEELSQINTAASVNYVFNITNLFNGYDMDRRWNVEMFAGPLFGGVTENYTDKKLAFGIHAGGRVSYSPTEGFDFYLEPRMYGYTRRLFPMLSGSPAVANLNFGSTYHFMYRGRKMKSPFAEGGFFDNTFLGFSAGLTNSLNNFVSDYTASQKMHSFGPEYSISLGKWVNPYIGFRTSFTGSFFTSDISDDNQNDKISAYIGGGFDVMFNPFKLANPYEDYKFEVVPFAGFDIRKLFRQMPGEYVDSTPATSLSAGLQFRYNIAKNISVVLEPAYSRVPYTMTENGDKIKRNENIFSLSLGLELRHTNKQKRENQEIQNSEFERSWFASVNGGMNLFLEHTRKNNSNIGGSVELYGGYSFTPLSALRLGFDYSRVNGLDNVNKYNMYSVAMNYMFDLGRFVSRTNEMDIFGVHLFAGPVLSIKDGVNKKTGVGAEIGVLNTFRVNKNIYINVQPKMRMYTKSFSGVEGGDTPVYFSLSAGLCYTF